MSGTPVPANDRAVLTNSDVSTKQISLQTSEIHIGRGPFGNNDIKISTEDEKASREHARIIYEGGQWIFEDKSTNGTLIDGELVHKTRIPLRPQSRIQIGQSFDYIFSVVGSTIVSGEFASVNRPMSGSLTHETPVTKKGIWISGSAAVWRDGVRLSTDLSRTEYRLLMYLAKRAGDVCDYESTIRAVWDKERRKDTLHELIYRVRHKIEPDPAQPRYLIIRAGIGVVFFPQGIDNAV